MRKPPTRTHLHTHTHTRCSALTLNFHANTHNVKNYPYATFSIMEYQKVGDIEQHQAVADNQNPQRSAAQHSDRESMTSYEAAATLLLMRNQQLSVVGAQQLAAAVDRHQGKSPHSPATSDKKIIFRGHKHRYYMLNNLSDEVNGVGTSDDSANDEGSMDTSDSETYGSTDANNSPIRQSVPVRYRTRNEYIEYALMARLAHADGAGLKTMRKDNKYELAALKRLDSGVVRQLNF